MQLVLCNNRVMAHGECFLAMGGVVINTETGAKYENATIAECDSCPSDIGKVGYEYRAGVFTPCAPYGKGDGTVPVLCDDECKAIKDSGIPMNTVCLVETVPYKGTGGSSVTLTFSRQPLFVIIEWTYADDGGYMGYLCGNNGLFFNRNTSATSYKPIYPVTVTMNGATITFTGGGGGDKICNANGGSYIATAFSVKGE